jgi:hypothetical protein
MKSFIVAAGLIGLVAAAYAPIPAVAAPHPQQPKLDADGDGKVTFAEFNAAAAMRFARFDVNNDGQISKEEFDARHKLRDAAGPKPPKAQRPRRPGTMPRLGFSRMDKDKDGAVSHDEFERGVQRLFTSLDTDKDGVLSFDELSADKVGGGAGAHGHK